ncbi:MAG TPA: hypothetical protein VFY29_05085 [Terriglobia bacterium]|nr:hypothetical protein [Terriglobia bacterium]
MDINRKQHDQSIDGKQQLLERPRQVGLRVVSKLTGHNRAKPDFAVAPIVFGCRSRAAAHSQPLNVRRALDLGPESARTGARGTRRSTPLRTTGRGNGTGEPFTATVQSAVWL